MFPLRLGVWVLFTKIIVVPILRFTGFTFIKFSPENELDYQNESPTIFWLLKYETNDLLQRVKVYESVFEHTLHLF